MARHRDHEWLWPAFQNLVSIHQLTSVDAIERLSQLYPGLPVLDIVTASAEGRKPERKAPEPDPNDMNGLIRARASSRSNQVTEEQPAPESQDFIRARFAQRQRGEG